MTFLIGGVSEKGPTDPWAGEKTRAKHIGLFLTPELGQERGRTRQREFFVYLLQQDPTPDRYVVDAFFDEWIKQDPNSAFAAALRLPKRFGYDESNPFFLTQIGLMYQRDPFAALYWAGKIERIISGGATLGVSGAPFANVANPESLAQVAEALNQTRRGDYTQALAKAYAEHLAESDLEAAKDFLAQVDPEMRSAIFPAIAEAWALEDPQGLLDYLKTADPGIRQESTIATLRKLAGLSSGERMNWLQQEVGITSFSGLGNLMNGMFLEDRQAAKNYVTGIEYAPLREEALAGLASSYCLLDPDSALDLIISLPPDLIIQAARAGMRTRLPKNFSEFLRPLEGAQMDTGLRSQYIDELANYITNDYLGRMVPGVDEQVEYISSWLSANESDGRDELVRVIESRVENLELLQRLLGSPSSDGNR